jgi:hypothetical protein
MYMLCTLLCLISLGCAYIYSARKTEWRSNDHDCEPRSMNMLSTVKSHAKSCHKSCVGLHIVTVQIRVYGHFLWVPVLYHWVLIFFTPRHHMIKVGLPPFMAVLQVVLLKFYSEFTCKPQFVKSWCAMIK